MIKINMHSRKKQVFTVTLLISHIFNHSFASGLNQYLKLQLALREFKRYEKENTATRNFNIFSKLLTEKEVTKYHQKPIFALMEFNKKVLESITIKYKAETLSNNEGLIYIATARELSHHENINTYLKKQIASINNRSSTSPDSLDTLTKAHTLLLDLHDDCIKVLKKQKLTYGILNQNTLKLHKEILHEGLRLEKLISNNKELRAIEREYAKKQRNSMAKKEHKKRPKKTSRNRSEISEKEEKLKGNVNLFIRQRETRRAKKVCNGPVFKQPRR